MLCFCIALHCEAKPLIEHFGLTKDTLSPGQAFFKGPGIMLIESGIGKVRAAVAVTRLLSTQPSLANVTVMNFGTCGSAQNHPRGKVFVINKIHDASSESSFYPDILFKHSLPEANLTTFEKPVTKKDPLNQGIQLVDMEASGFFEAASMFLAPSRIGCLKIVSDNLEGESIPGQELTELITKSLPAIIRTIEAFTSTNIDPDPALTLSIQETLGRMALRLRLTHAQEKTLYKAIQGFVIRRGPDLAWTEKLLPNTIQSKTEAKKTFAKLLAALNETAV